MCRSPHGTPIHAQRCATTEPARTSTDTPTTSSPPTWPPAPELTSCRAEIRLSAADRAGPDRLASGPVRVTCGRQTFLPQTEKGGPYTDAGGVPSSDAAGRGPG